MQEHGYFQLEIIDKTIVVKCFDAWNIETVLRLCRECKALAKTISHQPWACLVDMTHWELATPDMWDEIAKLNQWSNEHNQRFEAVVCGMALQKQLMADSHTVLTNVETKFCDSLSQAYAWLYELGMLNNIPTEQ